MYQKPYSYGMTGGQSLFAPQHHPVVSHATSLRYTSYTTAALPLHHPKRPAYEPYYCLDLSKTASSTPKCTGKSTTENERCPNCRTKGPHAVSSHSKTAPTALKRQDAAIGGALTAMKATAADAVSFL